MNRIRTLDHGDARSFSVRVGAYRARIDATVTSQASTNLAGRSNRPARRAGRLKPCVRLRQNRDPLLCRVSALEPIPQDPTQSISFIPKIGEEQARRRYR